MTTSNHWYVLVREFPGEDWTRVAALSKETAYVLAPEFESRGWDSVVGYGAPDFCGCAPQARMFA